MSQTTPEAPSKAINGSPLIGMVPWVVFAIVAKRAHVEFGAIAAFVAAVFITVKSVGSGESLKVLDAGSLVAFAALAIIGGLADPARGRRPARLLAGHRRRAPLPDRVRLAARHALHGAVRAGVDPAGTVVFPGLPEDQSRAHRDVGGAFALMAVGHVIATQVDSRSGDTLFNWVVPIGLIVGMIRFTESYVARARGGARSAAGSRVAA